MGLSLSALLWLGACAAERLAGDTNSTGDSSTGDSSMGDSSTGDTSTGDTSTTGDTATTGDSECECPGQGPFDQCPSNAYVSTLDSTPPLSLPTSPNFDDMCTITSVQPSLVWLDCETAEAQIALALTGSPSWSPPLVVDDQVRFRTQGSAVYFSWRIDRASDGQLLSSYSAGEQLALIDDELDTQVVSGLCPKTCDIEYTSELAALSFELDGEQVMLFPGDTGTLGELDIFVGRATHRACFISDDLAPGRYQVLVTMPPPPPPPPPP